jgi:hypothetical protein
VGGCKERVKEVNMVDILCMKMGKRDLLKLFQERDTKDKNGGGELD